MCHPHTNHVKVSLRQEDFTNTFNEFNQMFGKATCKICGDEVRFVLKHLKQKHPEILGDMDVAKLKMESIIKKYFSE
jgi:hypothetical protein